MTVVVIQPINDNLIEVYQPEIEVVGMNCAICEKELQVGDYVDGLYPYFTENNRCVRCKEVHPC